MGHQLNRWSTLEPHLFAHVLTYCNPSTRDKDRFYAVDAPKPLSRRALDGILRVWDVWIKLQALNWRLNLWVKTHTHTPLMDQVTQVGFHLGFVIGSTVTLTVTTSFLPKVLPSITADAKAADLRKLYDMVEKRHAEFMNKTLHRLPKSYLKESEFQGMEKTTFLLER